MGVALSLAPTTSPEVFPIAGSFGLAQIFAMKAWPVLVKRVGGAVLKKPWEVFKKGEKVYEYIFYI